MARGPMELHVGTTLSQPGRFLKARVGTQKTALMHWQRKILIFLHENANVLETEDGWLEAWERKILFFLQGNKGFRRHEWGQTKVR